MAPELHPLRLQQGLGGSEGIQLRSSLATVQLTASRGRALGAEGGISRSQGPAMLLELDAIVWACNQLLARHRQPRRFLPVLGSDLGQAYYCLDAASARELEGYPFWETSLEGLAPLTGWRAR